MKIETTLQHFEKKAAPVKGLGTGTRQDPILNPGRLLMTAPPCPDCRMAMQHCKC